MSQVRLHCPGCKRLVRLDQGIVSNHRLQQPHATSTTDETGTLHKIRAFMPCGWNGAQVRFVEDGDA